MSIEIIKEEPAGVPPNATRFWVRLKGEVYCVLRSQDEYGRGDLRWHISVSRNSDLEAGNHDVPVWRDFVAIVHFMRPGVPFVIGIPPENQWMNANPNVLHAHETKDPNLIEEWKINAQAVKGTHMAVPS